MVTHNCGLMGGKIHFSDLNSLKLFFVHYDWLEWYRPTTILIVVLPKEIGVIFWKMGQKIGVSRCQDCQHEVRIWRGRAIFVRIVRRWANKKDENLENQDIQGFLFPVRIFWQNSTLALSWLENEHKIAEPNSFYLRISPENVSWVHSQGVHSQINICLENV